MLKVFDYRCESTNEVFERMVDGSHERVQCNCGAEAKRLIGATKTHLDPLSGHFPGATMKWAKHHEQAAKVSGQA